MPIRLLDGHYCNARVAGHIVWLDRRARITHRVRLWVEALAQLLPVAHGARLTRLHWYIIKEIDHRRLKHLHGDFSAEGVRRLVMDEFALHEGHRYTTVALDAKRMLVLLVGESNSREAIQPVIEIVREKGCQRIEAVAMDLNTAMEL